MLTSVPVALPDPLYSTADQYRFGDYGAGSGILPNDFDADGNSLSAARSTNPANGSLLSFNANGTFTYRPNTSFSGIDTFTYKVNDGTQRLQRRHGQHRRRRPFWPAHQSRRSAGQWDAHDRRLDAHAAADAGPSACLSLGYGQSAAGRRARNVAPLDERRSRFDRRPAHVQRRAGPPSATPTAACRPATRFALSCRPMARPSPPATTTGRSRSLPGSAATATAAPTPVRRPSSTARAASTARAGGWTASISSSSAARCFAGQGQRRHPLVQERRRGGYLKAPGDTTFRRS